ncbi:GNAT family N-acetyltransferase [Caldanaerobius polysaccharolyticus]|uniref:GNAT family N-acetyltransferase n=1 Tax=Caldanaerobius polysaccharolyticus TaxID=44256 RepID=UPI00047C23D6|nr:GNAT family N-acetyltransferase [Caldanaerobius polysaccharolyticus]
MAIKFVPLEEFDRVHAIATYCFPWMHDAKDKIKNYLQQYVKSEYILGYYDESGTLMAQVVVFPFEIYIGGKPLKMGGVALVSSMPEGRHGGRVGQLLTEWLKVMRDRGQYVSMLGPFSFEFYRKYGWELGFERVVYTVPIEHIKGFKKMGRVRAVTPGDIGILDRIYTKYALNHNGCAKRDEMLWNEFTLSHPWSDNYGRYAYIYLDEKGDGKGYIIFTVKNGRMDIYEMIYEDIEALKGLLAFIYAHQSQIGEFSWSTATDEKLHVLLPNPRVKREIQAGMMFRVVDVKEAVKKRGYAKNASGRFKIEIEDKNAPWNQKPLDICLENGSVEVGECSDPQLFCDIQTFSQIFVGFITPMEAYALGKLTGKIEAVEQMEKVYTKSHTYNNNSF